MTDDLISRQAVLEINEKYWIRGFNLGYADKVKYEVKALPFVDAVEVVRCKDCIYHREAHYESDGESPYIKHVCRLFKGYQFQQHDFCSYGKRKEGKS